MNQSEMRQALTTIQTALADDTPRGANEAKFQAISIAAVAVLGEVALDIKRCADALTKIADEFGK